MSSGLVRFVKSDLTWFGQILKSDLIIDCPILRNFDDDLSAPYIGGWVLCWTDNRRSEAYLGIKGNALDGSLRTTV